MSDKGSSIIFKKIGLFAKHNNRDVKDTFDNVITFLHDRGHQLVIEQHSAEMMEISEYKILPSDQIGQYCDLIIVVGGDGSLLKAARAIVDYNVPVLGINRGKLGFLADIRPDQLELSLTPILEGHYSEEERCLLTATVTRSGNVVVTHCALNDIVLYSSGIARMIEFEMFINEQFVLAQRSDGLITATPTGSTAYSLSGGGPILYPTLNAVTIVSMFPHTLSTRPIVISDQAQIKLILSPNNEVQAKLSCDGQYHVNIQSEDEVILKKHPKNLRLLHPEGYNYFALLRKKLGWHTQFTSDR